jgi:hypothetical protein
MTRSYLFAAALVVATLAVASTGAVAQADPANNSTTADGGEVHVVNKDLGDLRLISWQYLGEGRFSMRVAAQRPTQVRFTDSSGIVAALSEGDGARSADVRDRSMDVYAGTHTVEFVATVHEDVAAVTLATPSDIFLLRSDALDTGRPPVEFSAAIFAVVATFGGTAYVTARHVRREQEQDDVAEAERIA